MFAEKDLSTGYVPEILILLGASEEGVDLDDLADRVRETLTGKAPSKPTFEKHLNRSILVTLAFGLSEFRALGSSRRLALRGGSTTEAAPVAVGPEIAPAATARSAPAGGGEDYQGAIVAVLGSGALNLAQLEAGVRQKIADFVDYFFLIALGRLRQDGKVIQGADQLYRNAPGAGGSA